MPDTTYGSCSAVSARSAVAFSPPLSSRVRLKPDTTYGSCSAVSACSAVALSSRPCPRCPRSGRVADAGHYVRQLLGGLCALRGCFFAAVVLTGPAKAGHYVRQLLGGVCVLR